MPTDTITDNIELVANLNFSVPQVVQQYTLGEVGYIIRVLFKIYPLYNGKEFWKSARFWQSYRHHAVGGPLLGYNVLLHV